MSYTVTVQLPEEIYRRLERSTQVANKPVEDLLVQSIKAGMLPSVNHMPSQYREECLALERLSDKRLPQVAESTLPEGRQRRYAHLLRKNQASYLTRQEREQLNRLGIEARRLILRKAYAYALLKWRGKRIPTSADLK
jgi:hypothetical protein